MTREEAIHIFENSRLVSEYFTPEAMTAVYVTALTALRPVSRERVEKWRGEWVSTGVISCKCSKCNKLMLKSNAHEYNFCPYCMAPVTDEAVDMVMERLEALKDGSETD